MLRHQAPRFARATLRAESIAGTHRAEHPDYKPDLNFKKAKAEKHGEQPELL